MNIGILGAGHIGTATSQLFAKAGHSVAISNSHGPESLTTSPDSHIKAVTAEEAVRFGDIILIAIPWTKLETLPEAQLFENKIVIDATNAFGPTGPVDLGGSTSSEVVSKQLPGARLVKAFNTLNSEILRTSSHPAGPDRLALFIAGDDTEAKDEVARLIEEAGYAAVDTGFLHDGGRLQQPGSPIFNVALTIEEAGKRLSDLK